MRSRQLVAKQIVANPTTFVALNCPVDAPTNRALMILGRTTMAALHAQAMGRIPVGQGGSYPIMYKSTQEEAISPQ